MSGALVRLLLEQLADPTYAGEFTDVLMLRATAADEGEPKEVRLDAQERAGVLMGELVDALAAEMALREPVAV